MNTILSTALVAALTLTFALSVQADTPGTAAVAGAAAYECSTAPKASAQLSTPVQGAGGNALRLDFRPGNGWRFLDAPGNGASARKVGIDIPEALEPDHALPVEHPLSVTVDGPTGFVFAWMHETASWKFVGRVGGHPQPGRPIPWQRIQPSFTGELLLMIS